jgi:MFS family permease
MKCLLAHDILVLRSLPLRLPRRRFVSTFKADKYYVFRTLGLNTFSDTELKNSYREIFSRESKGNLEAGLRAVVLRKEKGGFVNSEEEIDEKVRQLAAYMRKKGVVVSHFDWIFRPSLQSQEKDEEVIIVDGKPARYTYDMFKSRMMKSAEQLDARVPAVSVSCALAGTSTGIIIPCMPMLVQTIGMPPSEFGLVIAAFGLSKLLGNIPSAYFVDTYGRKPVMVAGLILCSVGLGGVGLTLVDGFGTPWLIFMRLVSGLGVSAFSGGLNMLLSDISTGLNRTRTYAPVLSSYQAGTAFGPAIGGFLINHFGIAATYFTVGGAFAVMASLNQVLLKETMPGRTIYQIRADEKRAEERTRTSPAPPVLTVSVSEKKKSGFSDVLGSFKITLLSWKELMKVPALRDLMILHGCYWTALAGTSMTLLPLLMVRTFYP